MPINASAPPRVALVHDWLHTFRGGEKVLEQLCHLFPNAEIFTLFYRSENLPNVICDRPIHTSFLNKLPGITKYYRHLLPLFPLAIEKFNLSKFDLIISTSHCVAKGILPPPQAKHICYCFTPMRYSWDRYEDYFGGKLIEPLIAPFIHYLRIWDVTSSQRVDNFVSISDWVSRRVKRYYNRSSKILYPPVDTNYYTLSTKPREDYYLVASAFAPYKRIDLAIDACSKLGKKLVVVGDGQMDYQKKTNNIQFVGRVSDEHLRDYYSKAKALLFPGEEDFGIVPLEAQACGTPVIAYGRGGCLETILDKSTGLFFKEQSTEALTQSIIEFENRSWDPLKCRLQAERFSTARFLDEFQKLCQETLRSQALPS